MRNTFNLGGLRNTDVILLSSSLVFSLLLKERNPISTRIELASLGLAGVFWLGKSQPCLGFFLCIEGSEVSNLHPLVLGVYLTTSESQSADVECFASETSQVVLDPEIANCKLTFLLRYYITVS